MTLEKYYLKAHSNENCRNVVTAEEFGNLQASIIEFFQGFEKAKKEDCKNENCEALRLTKNAYATNAYLSENRTSLQGLALYLLDFRGANDVFFKKEKIDLYGLMYMIFTYNYMFQEADFRLLELTKAKSFALQMPEKDNVTLFIIKHFNEFSPFELNTIFRRLNRMKKRLKKSPYKLENYTYQYILYNMISRKLPFFRRLCLRK